MLRLDEEIMLLAALDARSLESLEEQLEDPKLSVVEGALLRIIIAQRKSLVVPVSKESDL